MTTLKKITMPAAPAPRGAGGGKGGGGGGHEADNTLRSGARVKFIQVLSEGPVVGPVTGDYKSYYFDDTPLLNEDGSFNLPGGNEGEFKVEFLPGNPDDGPIPGFPEQLSFNGFDLLIEAKNPSGVAKEIEKDLDAIMVKIALPNGLFKMDDQGNIDGYQLHFQIHYKSKSETSWILAHDVNFNDKTMSAFNRDYQVNRPSTSQTLDENWNVRVTKLSEDPVSVKTKDTLKWIGYTGVQFKNISYPNAAVIGVRADAKATGGQIPTISVDMFGLKIQVPVNYDGQKREYAGATWNGQFKPGLEWTDNTSWILYSCLTNERWGLGKWIKPDMIDKSSFFAAAQYCDGRVPIGDGTWQVPPAAGAPGILAVEPRFSFNGQIFKQESAIKVLNAIASNMRATLVVQNGLIKVVQDRPRAAVALVTNANVKDGRFTYVGTDGMTRYTAADITYNDVKNNFLQEIVHFEDPNGIKRHGYQVAQEAAFGVTNKGQALRHGRWVVDTSIYQTESVTFTGTLDLVGLEVGDVFRLHDNNKTNNQIAGRIKSDATSLTQFEIDRPITFTADTVFSIMHDDGTFQEVKPLQTSGTHTVVDLPITGQLTKLPKKGAVFIARGKSYTKLFEVRKIALGDKPNEIEFSALEYDPSKYARVENGAAYEPPLVEKPQVETIGRVTGLEFIPQAVKDKVGNDRVDLHIKWDQHMDEHFTTFKYRWRKDGAGWSQFIYNVSNTFVINSILAGVYDFQIYAVNFTGVTSPVTMDSFTFGYAGTNSLLAPLNLRLQEGRGDADLFIGNSLDVQWDENPANNEIPFQTVGGYQVQYSTYVNGVETVVATYALDRYTLKHNYSYEENSRNTGPFRSLIVRVKTLDGFGNPSSEAISVWFHNPAPGRPNLKLTPGYDLMFAEYKLPTPDNDFLGFKVWASKAGENFQIDDRPVSDGGNLVYKGLADNCSFPADPNTQYWVKVAGYDQFSEDPALLIVSDEEDAIVRKVFSQNEYTVTDVTFWADAATNTVHWTSGKISKTSGEDAGAVWPIASGSLPYTSGTLYVYWLEGQTTMMGSTSLVTAQTGNGRVFATYHGGTNLKSGNGDFFVDGANIYAQTVSATQLVANQAVITGEVQMGSATVNTAAIRDLAVTSAKVKDLTADKIKSGSIQVTETISSTGYQAGVQGWAISGNGDVEIQNLKARGDITANHLEAATGTFSGSLQAATGTFSGSLQAATGTFSGSVTGSTFTGVVMNTSVLKTSKIEIGTGGVSFYDTAYGPNYPMNSTAMSYVGISQSGLQGTSVYVPETTSCSTDPKYGNTYCSTVPAHWETQYGTYVISPDELLFTTATGTSAVNRRIKSSGVQMFQVFATMYLDHYFTIWVLSPGYNGGNWFPIATMTETQKDYGPIALNAAWAIDMYPGRWVRFGVSATDTGMNMLNTGKPDISGTVIVNSVNF